MNDTPSNRMQHSPGQLRRFLKPTLVIIGALVCIFWLSQWHHRSQPEYVLEILDRVNTPSDIQRYSEYFTPKGKENLVWLLSKAGDVPSSGNKMTYSEPIINGDTCDIPARGPGIIVSVRLHKSGRWRFDDFYLESVQSEQIKLWISYMREHPVKTFFKLNWKELARSFLKGFVIGMSAGKAG